MGPRRQAEEPGLASPRGTAEGQVFINRERQAPYTYRHSTEGNKKLGFLKKQHI